MTKRLFTRCAAVCMAAVMAMSPMSVSAATLLKKGSNGSQVKSVQSELKELGYFTYPKITGYYGSITVNAVKKFQKEHGLYVDGIIGKRTISALNCAITEKEKMAITNSIIYTVSDAASVATEEASESAEAILLNGDGGTAMTNGTEALDLSSADDKKIRKITGALDWFKEVRSLWNRGETAVVTDVITGKSFTVKRTYGTNHADVEPLTKADTEIIKKIWGGFSWERRAVTVEFGNYIIAGSMTAMPHAGLDSAKANVYVKNRSDGYGYGINLDSVKNNGANGVMDIHFKNSRTHTTNIVQKIHQDMVSKAADYLKKMKL